MLKAGSKARGRREKEQTEWLSRMRTKRRGAGEGKAPGCGREQGAEVQARARRAFCGREQGEQGAGKSKRRGAVESKVSGVWARARRLGMVESKALGYGQEQGATV
jgi:hypothetical protein